ncbi:MAG: flagellar hook protein [endosymbiont of Galathealinum brachiosum]|uniref:Flagellar hook-associated protein 2 n=1 Tax=endosymbiont of Galathealinum brachiosum TaxID=2200906 RepID=A0A370DJE8_9GAMM|nr:MAG: flagellar hook protein [endosymbiont of Galathealinum brachiosum]
MATISAAGIGSGLDVSSILEQIVEAERAPTENRLNLKEATLQAELSAFGTIKGAVSSFQSSFGKLTSAALFNSSKVSVSDQDVLSASTSSIAKAGNFSVEVKSLAQSHTLASIAFDSLDEVIGNGDLTFSFGTTVYDPGTDFATGDDTYTSFTNNTERSSETVEIDSSNNTVSGVRDAINAADIGVTASIVDDGSGFRLLITSDQQGLDNSIGITVEEGGAAGDNIDTTGLSVLAFNGTATNVEQTQAASDAELTINGLTVFRETNTVTGAIPGITLNLKSADIGNPVQVSISDNNSNEAEKNISNFVSSFNEMAEVFNSLTAYGGEGGQNGVLLGDTTTRNLMQQIRRDLGGFVDNAGSFNSLSSIGITTNRDGTLALDSNKLNDALSEDFDSVAQLFYANGNSSDSEVIVTNSSLSTQEGRYAVSIGALATKGTFDAVATTGPITIDSSNSSFAIRVDGISSGTVSLSEATYTDMDSLAQEIENRINASNSLQSEGLGVSVSYESGAFKVTSNSYGSDSKLSISSENSALGFISGGVSTDGEDVTGTIGGLPATGSGRFLTGSGAATGLVLEITGSNAGNRGAVTFSRGLASKLNTLLTEFQNQDGQLTAKTDSINDQIESIFQERIDLTKRVNDIEDRYRRQFSTLDVLVSQLNATSNFLTQQLDALPGVTFNQN